MPSHDQDPSTQPQHRGRSRAAERPCGAQPYPPYVNTDSERRRWELSEQAAYRLFEDVGADNVLIWTTTRSLYRSDIPTGVPDESAAARTKDGEA